MQICVVLTLLFPFPSRAQTPPEEAVFRDAQPVTAIDVLVTLDREGFKEWAAGSAVPQRLTTEDFVVRVDDEPVDVVAVGPPAEGRWHFQVYIDAPLTAPETVHWASTLLSEHVDSLLSLGVIEIVVADPSPRRLLRPTADQDEVARVLSQLALDPVGKAELHALRDAFLQQRADGFPDLPPDELIPLLVTEERLYVQQRHDTLISWLADGWAEGDSHLPVGDPDTLTTTPDRRAFLYISDGFDADPKIFYGPFLEDEQSTDSIASPKPLSEAGGVDLPLRQTLSSYGWVALPMLPPQPELLKRGLRLGKFLIRPVGLHMADAEPPDSARADQPGLRGLFQRLNWIFLGGVHMTYEEHRDPDKAEAYLELARALHGQSKLEDAAEAYEKALFHFSGDPRTADQQAIALAGIGDLMAEMGEGLGAQRAYHKALSLDPTLAEDVGSGIAFQDPAATLQNWADATVGHLVRGREELRRFVDGAASRIRLTYQLAEAPAGRFLDLDVQTPQRPDPWRYPAWHRSGTPEAVSAARLRQALQGMGDLWLPEDAVVQPPGAEPPPIVTLRRDAGGPAQIFLRHPATLLGQSAWPAAESKPPPVHTRVSIAGVSATSGEIEVIHRDIWLDGPQRVLEHTDVLPQDAVAWGLLVEDLSTGSRRLRVLDRP